MKNSRIKGDAFKYLYFFLPHESIHLIQYLKIKYQKGIRNRTIWIELNLWVLSNMNWPKALALNEKLLN